VGLAFAEAEQMIGQQPQTFKELVDQSLRRQVLAINALSQQGMAFWDYGNAFLLQAGRAGAEVMRADGTFRYPSYVEDIMGPMCFDYGFGPFRWVCTSCEAEDLQLTDALAREVMALLAREAPTATRQQLLDNLHWIEAAAQHQLVVGSQARILYSDAWGRIQLALSFNRAVADGRLRAPVVLGRDHHDVSGTDSPYRETADMADGSRFCADMAVHNVIGDGFRGATWISLHNGGGVGWGEAINGGFGLLLDGTATAEQNIRRMIHWDVNHGIARRSWAGHEGAKATILRAMEQEPLLCPTLPSSIDPDLVQEGLEKAFG
jgi:urocanate hydratase